MSRVNSLKQLMTLQPQDSCQLDPRIAIGDPLVFAASCSGLASTRGLCVFLVVPHHYLQRRAWFKQTAKNKATETKRKQRQSGKTRGTTRTNANTCCRIKTNENRQKNIVCVIGMSLLRGFLFALCFHFLVVFFCIWTSLDLTMPPRFPSYVTPIRAPHERDEGFSSL